MDWLKYGGIKKMELSTFEIYLIIINIIGFFLYCINMLLYTYAGNGQIDKALTITSFLCGSLGILIAIILFDRKNVKENMMFRVFVICICIIQVVLLLMFKKSNSNKISLAIWELYNNYKIFPIYLIIINLITFTAFAIDKRRALQGTWRFKIVTLLGLCFVGGSIGGLLSMYIFRHKTSTDYFTRGIPIIMIMQVVVTIFIVNIMKGNVLI